MKDRYKTKEQLVDELTLLRQQLKKSKTSETRRKRMEHTIKVSEERYRALIEQSLQAIVIVQDLLIVFANNAFAKISGYTVKELLVLPFSSHVFIKDIITIYKGFSKLLRS